MNDAFLNTIKKFFSVYLGPTRQYFCLYSTLFFKRKKELSTICRYVDYYLVGFFIFAEILSTRSLTEKIRLFYSSRYAAGKFRKNDKKLLENGLNRAGQRSNISSRRVTRRGEVSPALFQKLA